MKLQASVCRGSISSDEHDEASLDVSGSWSDSEDQSPAYSDGDIGQEHRDSEDQSPAYSDGDIRQEHHAAQVSTLC